MDEILLPENSGKIEKTEFLLATIASTSSSGITLIFDGQTEASQKKYKNIYNLDPYVVGDRVVVMKHSGTYIILGALKDSAFPVWYTTTVSNIISAASGFSITEAYYYWYGRMAQLYVKAAATSGVSTAAWTTVGTLAESRRPVANVLMSELTGKTNCLYSNGNLRIYGTHSSGTSFEFYASYIHK